jgi:hypothetical protein
MVISHSQELFTIRCGNVDNFTRRTHSGVSSIIAAENLQNPRLNKPPGAAVILARGRDANWHKMLAASPLVLGPQTRDPPLWPNRPDVVQVSRGGRKNRSVRRNQSGSDNGLAQPGTRLTAIGAGREGDRLFAMADDARAADASHDEERSGLPRHLAALVGSLKGPADLGRNHDRYLAYPDRDGDSGAAAG